MAAPAFGSAGTYLAGASSTTAAFAVPASVAANDVIVVSYYSEDAVGTITAPGGFTVKTDTIVTGNHRLVIAWKRATGADTGTYSFTTTNAAWREGGAVRYTGVVQSGDPFDVTSTNQAQTGTTTPAVSVTTTQADTLLVWAMSNFNGGTAAAPSGYTLRLNTAGGDAAQATLAQPTAGGSGSITATAPANTKQTAFLGALKPNASSFVGTPTDTRGTIDTLTFASTETLLDLRGLSDSPNVSADFPRSFTEDRGSVDALALLLNHIVDLAEDRSLTDAINRDFGLNPTDDRGEQDTSGEVGVFTPLLLENRGLTDFPTASDILGVQTDDRGLSDSIVTTIIPAGANNTTAFPNDNRGLTDTGAVKSFSGATFDARGLVDDCLVTLTGNQNFIVSPTDSRGLTDGPTIFDRQGFEVEDTFRTDEVTTDLVRDTLQTLTLTDDRGIQDDTVYPATDNGTPKTTTLSDDRGIGDPTAGGGFIDIEQFLSDERGSLDNLATFVIHDNQYTQSPTDERTLRDSGTVKDFDGQSIEERGLTDSVVVLFTPAPQALSVVLSDERGLLDTLVFRIAALALVDSTGLTDSIDAAIGVPLLVDITDSSGWTDEVVNDFETPILFFHSPTVKERLNTRDGLWARTYLDLGVSVLRFGDSYQQIPYPSSEQIESADAVFIGGRTYAIDFNEAVRLVQAGYGQYVTSDIDSPVPVGDFTAYGVGAYGTGPYGA